jgi:hypothetical protein
MFDNRRVNMSSGSSDQVRALASAKYVQPALKAGKSRFSVAVRDVIQDLVSQGFPPGNTPQVCTALRTKQFLREHGIEIEGIDGPPSKMSTTVVYRYRVAESGTQAEMTRTSSDGEETPEAWAHRLTGKLFGLLKDELAEYGGSEAFLRWVRSEEENAA